MPDSIFDLKQTLFTSNVPVPPRERASDQGPKFDQALDSAQRQSRDDRRTHETPKSKSPENQQPAEAKQADDATPADQDEVTLSQPVSETATKDLSAKKGSAEQSTTTSEAEEPTAAELAAAAVAPLEQPKPVLKQSLPEQPEESTQLEGIELNDAVQPRGKQSRLPGSSNQLPTSNIPGTTTESIEQNSTATTVTAAEINAQQVTAAAETKANQATGSKKAERTSHKQDQVNSNQTTTANQVADQQTSPEIAEEAKTTLAVSATPENEPSSPAPKRRTDTVRQSQPELSDNELKLAATVTLNTATAAAATPTTGSEQPFETAAKPAETAPLSAATPSPTETTPPPHYQRGPQIPNSFANRLEAANAERKAADNLQNVDRTRFVQRVARAFQRAGETEGEIRLRLSPPELGAVKLEVSLRDGAMIARMETETTTARNLLMENLPQLKERLAEQNVRIETFEVEVRDQTNQGSADDAREQLREQTEQQRNRLRGERATTPVVAQPIVRTLPAARQSSQLNIVI